MLTLKPGVNRPLSWYISHASLDRMVPPMLGTSGGDTPWSDIYWWQMKLKFTHIYSFQAGDMYPTEMLSCTKGKQRC